MEFFPENSLFTLFILSFLAATLLPLGSEWYLILLIYQGNDFSETIATATIGNYLGACTSYLVGRWGSTFFTERLFRIKSTDMQRARGLYERFGSWSLFFSWLPIIGDPLCVIGGVFRVHFLYYSLLVFSGKLLRYSTIAFLVRTGL